MLELNVLLVLKIDELDQLVDIGMLVEHARKILDCLLDRQPFVSVKILWQNTCSFLYVGLVFWILLSYLWCVVLRLLLGSGFSTFI